MDESEITDAKVEELVRALQTIGNQLDESLDIQLQRLLTANFENITVRNKIRDKIKESLTQLERSELNIAVTGESGSGKSTFINAFRGLGDEDEGAAETDVVETTIAPTAYPHPKFPNVKLWDLPGIGTPRFKADDYLKQVDFECYDFFIIIASDRFRECHAILAKEIVNLNKKFYFVRSKIDNNIKAEERKKTFNKEKTLDRIRENCQKGFQKIGLTSPAVFLISCFELNQYDFDCLVERMETELSEHKRNLLILAVPNISVEINERKKKALQYDIWMIALLSVVNVQGETIPVLNATTTIIVDLNLIMSVVKKYYNALSWDTDSLNKLSNISGRSVDELRIKLKSCLHQNITNELVISLLSNSNPIQSWLNRIPVLGSLTTPFSVVYNTLKSCLNEIADDAHNVLMVVLQSPV